MTNTQTSIMQAYEYDKIVKTHEKRAKNAIIKKAVAEFMAEGVDEATAKTMAKIFYEYNI